MPRKSWPANNEVTLVIFGALILAFGLSFLVTQRNWLPVPGSSTAGLWNPAPNGNPQNLGKYQVDCTNPKHHEEADICQQWRAANAAEKAATLAEAQTYWNWVQLIGILATLLAAWAAWKAAKAAQQSVGIADRAARIQLRAYVFIHNVECLWVANTGTEQITHWRFTPVWKNAGQTPTVYAIGNISHMYTETESLPEDSEFPDNAQQAARNLFPPGHTMLGQYFEIPISDLEKMNRGEARAFIWGWVEYNDVFECTARHRHEFCFEIIVVGNPNTKQGGFVYPHHGAFNGHDSECFRKPTVSANAANLVV